MRELTKRLLEETGMSQEDFDMKVEEYKTESTSQANMNNLGKTLVTIMKKQKELEDRLTAGGL
jgi:pantoate kinase